MPDDHRRAQLRELAAETRTKKVPWVQYAYVIFFGSVTFFILIALFILSAGPHGLFSDATSSVSNAPGP